ncbi:MAG TPA: BtrH N-terminal domain-containing protein [Myxococcales bacterium]|nr:BtrH N-terminal domain-containing protein [Myxococcales bacterium]
MHRKGQHCGSTAMGAALRVKGLDLPEDTVFGLGSGLGFSMHAGDVSLTPPQASRFFVGRSATFERDLCDAVGADLAVEQFGGADEAWERIEDLLAAGELPLVYTNLRELPYTGAHGNWYGHLVAVATRDALVWDNEFDQPQHIEPAQLRKALGGALPVPLDGVTVLHVSRAPAQVPAGAARKAIVRNALQMQESELARFPEEFAAWRALPDWPRIARLSAQVIEVRGCGGGLFRRMYARFLHAAEPRLAPLCEEAADAWSALALQLDDRAAEKCVAAETALWDRALELCE